MRVSARLTGRLLAAAVALAVCCHAGAALAAAPSLRTVRYHGFAVRVPRSWPVYDLAANPRVCVLLDRHALYLGEPSSQARCPSSAVGRTESIVIEPLRAGGARDGGLAGGAAPPLGGSATSFVVPSAGVRVIATWLHDRGLIARALDRSTLPRAGPPAASGRPGRARIVAAGARFADPVFEGLGFDACSTPSEQTMAAWLSSPYRAIGVYIGGVNFACALENQNLTASWVGAETAAGWHLIPTYVGLQAPSNGCGCQAMAAKPTQAAAEGTAAAEDAVADAQSVGIGPGNPIYDDMEGYARTSTNTQAVLAFLSAWTAQLHADGYLAGVYSNDDSGIADLASRYGTSYPEPDDVWFANWNGEQSTTSAYIPAGDWAGNQRLHQYRGGHNETYGGRTINIDNDYLDGATVSSGGTPPAGPPPPSLSVSPAPNGATDLEASWSGTGLAFWTVLGGPSPDPSAMTALATVTAHGSPTSISLGDEAPYFAVQALGSAGQLLATSPAVDTPAHIALFGRSAFVSQGGGVGALPAGCYAAQTCHVSVTISAGRTLIAKTGSERLGSGGLVFFRLSRAGLAMLARAPGRRLAVRVSSSGAGVRAASVPLNLIPFVTAGGSPKRGATQSAGLRIVGLTDFVSGNGWGGVLAACSSSTPCPVRARLAVGRTVIASTGPERIGANELGYVIFALTASGRQMLARAAGNQLVTGLLLSDGAYAASARIVLVGFH